MNGQRFALILAFHLLMLSHFHSLFWPGQAELELLLMFAVPFVVTSACVVDGRIVRHPVPHGAQLGILFTWPITAPVYVLWSRGAWGMVVLLIHAAILLASLILVVALWIFSEAGAPF
jgi:hypothetical protein